MWLLLVAEVAVAVLILQLAVEPEQLVKETEAVIAVDCTDMMPVVAVVLEQSVEMLLQEQKAAQVVLD
jgi:hypothetical protein